jgi:hypothetical protein
MNPRSLRRCLICRGATAFVLVCFLVFIAVAQTQEYRTNLTPNGRGIARHPTPLKLDRRTLPSLSVYDPSKKDTWQIDLRSYDLRSLDLSNRLTDLLMAHFDDLTRWPDRLPREYTPSLIMELGKNPGLGVRELHKKEISGKGVGIAIIDQGLLVDHAEYKDRLRLYEEIHCGDDSSAMHGPAVASIAAGKTVGVAPGADIYYIAETHGTFKPEGFDWDFTFLAQSIERILEVNRSLPEKERIRVISISVGWNSKQNGYAEVTAAVKKAANEGIFIISSSLFGTSGRRFAFHGLGRDPLADPDVFASYTPGLWWVDQFYSGKFGSAPNQEVLLAPMDSRATASPTGSKDYVFYRVGGWSWSIPWLAGLYALSCQVKPDITPEIFWETALATGDSLEFQPRQPSMSNEELEKQVKKIVDEQMAKFDARFGKGKDREKAMAEIYSQATGKKVERMSESEFRSWGAAVTREGLTGSGKPVLLKKIVNPRKLIDALMSLSSESAR